MADEAELLKLPPAITLTGKAPWKKVGDIKDVTEDDDDTSSGSTNTGAYLVRAVLTVSDDRNPTVVRESILDTAVFQSNNAK